MLVKSSSNEKRSSTNCPKWSSKAPDEEAITISAACVSFSWSSCYQFCRREHFALWVRSPRVLRSICTLSLVLRQKSAST
jgi:hypothetical protein